MTAGPIPFACYYGYSPELTGGPRTVLLFLAHLDPARFRPVLLTHRDSPLARGARDLGVEVELVPPPDVLAVQGERGLRYSWRERAASLAALAAYTGQVRRVLRRHAVRGVWARNAKSVLMVAAAARREGVPLVWDVGFEKPMVGIMGPLYGGALLASARVVTQSPAQPGEIFGRRLARVFASRMHSLSPGVDEDRAALLRAAAAGRARAGGRPTVLCVGALHPRKNQMMLLRALPALLARVPHAVVRLAGGPGDARYADEVRDFVRDRRLLDHVEFLGWREDVPALLGEAQVLALPSRAEGVPHVLREALHAALPVVATPVGGVPDGVVEGETGFLVPVDDHAALADRLALLLSDDGLRERMGECGARLGQERFSVARWSRAYQELLAGVFT